ncbi:MAG: helix-turn-helix domain-containing protein [Streptosporangiaceae bacterium]
MDKHNRVPDPVAQPLLTVAEAGAVLGMSRPSAYSAVRRGEIPVLRFGRRMMVPTARLRTMLGFENGGVS